MLKVKEQYAGWYTGSYIKEALYQMTHHSVASVLYQSSHYPSCDTHVLSN